MPSASRVLCCSPRHPRILRCLVGASVCCDLCRALCCLLLCVSGAAAEGPCSGRVLIIYATETNHTRELAAQLGQGARAVTRQVRVQSTTETNFTADVLEWADAIAIGSPTHYGNPAADLLTWVESEWEHHWSDPRLSSKIGGVFASGGGIAQGLEHVLAGLQRILWSFRIRVITPDPTRSGYTSYGAISVTGTPPFNTTALPEGFATAGQQFGSMLAKAAACAPTGTQHYLAPGA